MIREKQRLLFLQSLSKKLLQSVQHQNSMLRL